MSPTRWLVLIGLCGVLGGCASSATLKKPAPGGPAVSDLEFVPPRTFEGCPVRLRFHYVEGRMTSGVKGWTLIEGRAGHEEPADTEHPAWSGSLGGQASGDAAIPLTFQSWGTYRYYIQVEDEPGRWSTAPDAHVVVER